MVNIKKDERPHVHGLCSQGSIMCVRPECVHKINVVKCSLLVKESYLLKKKNTTYLKYAYYA